MPQHFDVLPSLLVGDWSYCADGVRYTRFEPFGALQVLVDKCRHRIAHAGLQTTLKERSAFAFLQAHKLKQVE